MSVIGAIVDYLHAPDDPEAVLTRMSDPAIKIVTLTVTEGGYNMDEKGHFKLEEPLVAEDLQNAIAPHLVRLHHGSAPAPARQRHRTLSRSCPATTCATTAM